MANGDKELDSDYKATLLKCLQCDAYDLPQIMYGFSTELEMDIAKDIEHILNKRKKN